jgi:hypothetical protein
MQASTASMCLRRLSDCVYSQSRAQADSRFGGTEVGIMGVLYLFLPIFTIFHGDDYPVLYAFFG